MANAPTGVSYGFAGNAAAVADDRRVGARRPGGLELDTIEGVLAEPKMAPWTMGDFARMPSTKMRPIAAAPMTKAATSPRITSSISRTPSGRISDHVTKE